MLGKVSAREDLPAFLPGGALKRLIFHLWFFLFLFFLLLFLKNPFVLEALREQVSSTQTVLHHSANMTCSECVCSLQQWSLVALSPFSYPQITEWTNKLNGYLPPHISSVGSLDNSTSLESLILCLLYRKYHFLPYPIHEGLLCSLPTWVSLSLPCPCQSLRTYLMSPSWTSSSVAAVSVFLLALQQMWVEKLLQCDADFQMVGVGKRRCDNRRGDLRKGWQEAADR